MPQDLNFSMPSRRRMFNKMLAISAVASSAMMGLSVPTISFAASLSQAQRDQMTPDDVIDRFRAGNLRFRENRPAKHDYLAQKRASAAGQFPAAVILSCIDSRAPAEIILDAGIGETFNSRVAGNVSNADVLGSMEFSCAAAGAKAVVVMGHSACGAVKGAIADAQLGNLTGLLAKIKPAIDQTDYAGARSPDNYDFVDAVARKHIELTIQDIRAKSPVLKGLETDGQIKIVGAFYQFKGGRVEFFDVAPNPSL